MPDEQLKKAAEHLRNRELDEAKSILVAYVDTNPDSADAWYMLSFIPKDRELKLDALLRALQLDPDSKHARERLSKLSAEPAPPKPESGASVFSESVSPPVGIPPMPEPAPQPEEAAPTPSFESTPSDEDVNEPYEDAFKTPEAKTGGNCMPFLIAGIVVLCLVAIGGAIIGYPAFQEMRVQAELTQAAQRVEVISMNMGEGTATLPSKWTPTPSPTPPPTSMPSPTPQPNKTAEYAPYQVDMASYGPDGGWIGLHGRYFWTTDQGESWQEFEVPDREGYRLFDLTFIDDQEAWTVWIPEDPAYDHTRLEIYRSTDRGASWEPVDFELDPIEEFARFAFYDLEVFNEDVIWIVADNTQTMNSHEGELLRTSDGGETWLRSELPYSGSVEFISQYIGWTTGSCCTGAPEMLFRTLDGGETWQEQVLVPDPVDDQFSYNHYNLPVFLNASDGVITVELKDADYQDIGIAVFYTADGGYNWTLAQRIKDFKSMVLDTEMVTEDSWFIRGSEGNFITFDGGKQWQWVNTPDVGEDYYFGTTMFDPYGYGWVMAHTADRNPQNRLNFLYTTEYWGRSWEAFDTGVLPR